MDLAQIYDRHAGRLWRHALSLTRHRADAEDAVQTVFLKLARQRRSRIRDIEAYLHTSVRRAALDCIARRERDARPPAPLVEPRNGLTDEDAGALNEALGRLPREQREVVVLHIWEGLTFRRIGELLGVSPDTAASRFRYARTKLKEWLGEDR